MRAPRLRRDEGMVSAFVVIFATALVLLAGLVVDGGAIVAARARAVDQAQSAARAGAQQIDLAAYRMDGTVVLDPSAATRAALDYLAILGSFAEVAVVGDEITVAVTIEQPLTVLDAGTGGTFSVTGHGAARPTQGPGP